MLDAGLGSVLNGFVLSVAVLDDGLGRVFNGFVLSLGIFVETAVSEMPHLERFAGFETNGLGELVMGLVRLWTGLVLLEGWD